MTNNTATQTLMALMAVFTTACGGSSFNEEPSDTSTGGLAGAVSTGGSTGGSAGSTGGSTGGSVPAEAGSPSTGGLAGSAGALQKGGSAGTPSTGGSAGVILTGGSPSTGGSAGSLQTGGSTGQDTIQCTEGTFKRCPCDLYPTGYFYRPCVEGNWAACECSNGEGVDNNGGAGGQGTGGSSTGGETQVLECTTAPTLNTTGPGIIYENCFGDECTTVVIPEEAKRFDCTLGSVTPDKPYCSGIRGTGYYYKIGENPEEAWAWRDWAFTICPENVTDLCAETKTTTIQCHYWGNATPPDKDYRCGSFAYGLLPDEAILDIDYIEISCVGGCTCHQITVHVV